MLKAIIKCSCGCKYELLSTSTKSVFECPSCGMEFAGSENLVKIFEAYSRITDTQELELFTCF
jgi:predicted RNA-binding Zn-ribbon protein involved in translation (DUF1610 family)